MDHSSEYDVAFLQKERDRIKADLEAKYGEQLKKMKEEHAGTMSTSPAVDRENRLRSMIENTTPLRQQVRATQDEALQKLIAHAKEETEAGRSTNADVQNRLATLLEMQKEHDMNSPPRSRGATDESSA